MKRILFIDDEKDPALFLDPDGGESTLSIAKSYDSAICFLESSKDWDEIYLDGDLGNTTKGGFQVLIWMKEHDYRPKLMHLISNSNWAVEMMTEFLVSDMNMEIMFTPNHTDRVTLQEKRADVNI